MDGATRDLLAVLVGHHPPATVAAVLHHSVVLHRADGTCTVGREAVVALFKAPDDGVRYRVVDTPGGPLVVAMEITAVPGMPRGSATLQFALHGVAVEGLLVEVRVELVPA